MSSEVGNKVDVAEGGKLSWKRLPSWLLWLTTTTSTKERGAPWDYDEGSSVQGDKKQIKSKLHWLQIIPRYVLSKI